MICVPYEGGLCPVYELGSWYRLPFFADALINSTTACRQIRAETEILFFENTELSFADWSITWKTLPKIEPRQRRAIKTLLIKIYTWPFEGGFHLLKHWDSLERVYIGSSSRSQRLLIALRTLFGKADLQSV